MRLYFLPIFISIIVLGSCKKSNNNETPESQFKQYEGTWLVAETDNGGSTINYTTNLTVNSDGSITFSNLSVYHKIITASYDNSSSPPHKFSGILVDVSTNTTLSAYFSFQSDATSKTMNASLTYFPDGGVGISGSTLNAIKE